MANIFMIADLHLGHGGFLKWADSSRSKLFNYLARHHYDTGR